MKDIRLFLLMFVSVLLYTSCESEINDDLSMITLEQFAPVQSENGDIILSAKVSLPAVFNRETAKVGFYIQEYDEYTDDYIEESVENVAYYYGRYLSGDYDYSEFESNGYRFADEIASDGNFTVSFSPELKQYVCVAFAFNLLPSSDEYYGDGIYRGQSVCSKTYYFSGTTTARLELIDVLSNEFKLSFNPSLGGDYYDIGFCYSLTNPLPMIEDSIVGGGSRSRAVDGEGNYTAYLDFGDVDLVYLRGYYKRQIQDNDNDGESYDMIYSNVIEFRPKEQVVNINSKTDFDSFVSSAYSAYEDDYYYHSSSIWNIYRGKINFGYNVQKEDWLSGVLGTDSTYYSIPNVLCTIEGQGTLPYVEEVSETGKIKGMTLNDCYRNYGTLENMQSAVVSYNYGCISNSANIRVSYNYGALLESKNIYVGTNKGLVQECIGGLYSAMIADNSSNGKIIGCSVDSTTQIVCTYNYGYMENCLPDSVCCRYNYGIIKN